MVGVAEVGAEYRGLGLNQLHSHGLVQDVAEALEEAMRRPDPVTLKGAPYLAYLAMFVGCVGHLPQELAGAGAHLAPESEAKGQELACLRAASWPVFFDLHVVRVL